jgi:hypothetical protein
MKHGKDYFIYFYIITQNTVLIIIVHGTEYQMFNMLQLMHFTKIKHL